MMALLLSLALFLSLGIVGLAILTVAGRLRNRLQALLLAPAVGLAAMLLVVFTLNRVGLPIGSFALISVPVALVVPLAVLWRMRPRLPWRQYAPLFAVFLVTLVAIGQPALVYGFEWVAYANDDMANEVLGAQHLIETGFPGPPDVDALIGGRDYTQTAWFAHRIGNERPGARMMVAWLGAWTGLAPHLAYMPWMVALHVVLSSAAAAMVASPRRSLLIPALTAGLVGFSALNAAATMNQLIGQVGGLSLLAGAAIVLFAPFERRPRQIIGQGVLIGLLGSMQSVWYPESVPMLVVAFILFLAVSVIQRRLRLRPMLPVLATTAVSALLFLNTFFPLALTYMLSQATGAQAFGSRQDETIQDLFSAYLRPDGLAMLWGFQVLGGRPMPEPWQSGTILLGAFFFVVALVMTTALAWRRQSYAIIALMMVLLSIPLAARQAGFGLYKMAMFVQPFVLGVLIVGWFSVTRQRCPRTAVSVRHQPALVQMQGASRAGLVTRASAFRVALQVALPVLLGLAGLQTQLMYVAMSGSFSTATHLPSGSETGIVSEFQRTLAALPPGPIILDTASPVLAKFQAVYTIGRQAAFPSRDFFTLRGRLCPHDQPDDPAEARPGKEIVPLLPAEETAGFCSVNNRAEFHVQGGPDAADLNLFRVNDVGEEPVADDCATLIATTGRQTVLNRRTADEFGANFVTYPCGTTDHLILVDSLLSQYYYGSRFGRTGLYALERETLWRAGTFSGVGRHLLFRVDHPSTAPRLMLEMTASLKGDGENRLPPAFAIGVARQHFGITGRGSARVFSPPLTPQMIDGIPYIAIDMGVDGQYFPERRTGLMQLWGTNTLIDSRQMTGFARDISLVSEDEYRTLAAPSVLRDPSSDLKDPNLEYSGLYEDGAVAESAHLALTQPVSDSRLVVKGEVPMIDDPNFTTEAQVLVDGHEVARRRLTIGSFALWGAAPGEVGRHRIELHFSHVQRFPDADQRPVAAVIQEIGFDGGANETPPEYLGELPAALVQPGVWAAGLARDGWIGDQSFFVFTAPDAPSDIVVRGSVPGLADTTFKTELRVLVDGHEAARKLIGIEEFELRAPAPYGPGRHRVELHFSAVQQLPFPDGRSMAALIRFVGFEASGGSLSASPPPHALQNIPSDLAHPGLRSAGVAPDGWLSVTSAFDLLQPDASPSVVVRGQVPMTGDPGFTTELRLLVDGQDVAQKTLTPGDFELQAPVSPGAAPRRIELRFSNGQQLPAPDGRLVGALLRYAGFEARSEPHPQPR